MFEMLRDDFRIWRLRQLRERNFREFRRAIRKLPSSDSEARDKIFEELGQMRLRAEFAINGIKTGRLLRAADRYDLPVPSMVFFGDKSPDYDRSPYDHTLVLNEQARASLRSAIRAERRERRDQWLWWLPFTFGLVGSITGLIAVLLKK